MTDKQAAEYGHLWGAEKDDYSLLSRDPGGSDLSRCFIINRKTKTITLIENRELVLEVMQRMVGAGVKIVSEPPAA